MSVSASDVKTLRDATGAGMMDCKKALTESGGDFERAREWLRVRGAAKADKVSGRAAAEGRVAAAVAAAGAALVEVNCETDFVARQAEFGDFCKAVAQALAEAGSDANLAELQLASGETAEATRQDLVMRMGENIVLNRGTVLPGGNCFYVHAGDRIAAAAAVSGGTSEGTGGTGGTGGWEELGREVCMHIAAMNPRFAGEGDVPAEFLEREKSVFAAQAAESGKPPEVAKKMAEGRMRKRLEEICLLHQPFVKDGEKTVGKILEGAGAALTGFSRMTVGAEDEFGGGAA